MKAIRGWRRRRAAPAPRALIERAKKLRQDILEHTSSLPEDQFLEIIIDDVARRNVFPEVDARSVGVSAWCEADLHGVYYNGIEVFMGQPQKAIQTIDPDDRFSMIWELVQPGEDPAGSVTAVPIGVFHLTPSRASPGIPTSSGVVLTSTVDTLARSADLLKT